MGTFYRTIRLVENGIKPVYVFDGKPPEMKSHQLNKRAERREEAEKELQKATEAGVLYCVLFFKKKNNFLQSTPFRVTYFDTRKETLGTRNQIVFG